jgi:hypothetical protein
MAEQDRLTDYLLEQFRDFSTKLDKLGEQLHAVINETTRWDMWKINVLDQQRKTNQKLQEAQDKIQVLEAWKQQQAGRDRRREMWLKTLSLPLAAAIVSSLFPLLKQAVLWLASQ